MTAVQLMTVEEVSSLLGYSRSHVLRLLSQGVIPGTKIGPSGRRWLIRSADVEQLLQPTNQTPRLGAAS